MPDNRSLPRLLRGPGYVAAAALVAAAVAGSALLSAAAPSTSELAITRSITVTTESPVADAAMRGDSAKVRALLKQGADVNASQADGMSALHWAAARGDAAQVKVLVFAGARLENTTRNGSFTPLHLAAQAGRGAAVRALLESGANVNAATSSGGATALHLAAQQGNVEAVKALLDFKAVVDAPESAYDQTPLMWAATYDRVGAIEALVAKGANVEAVSKVENMAERETADRASNALRNRKVAALKSAENAPALPSAGTPRGGDAGAPGAGASGGRGAGAPGGRGAGAGATAPATSTVAAANGAGLNNLPASGAADAPATKVASADAGKDAKKDDKKNDDKSKKSDAKKADEKNADAPKSVSVPRGDVAAKSAATSAATDSALAANAPKPMAARDTSAATGPVIGGTQAAQGGGRGGRGQSYGDLVGNKGGLTPLLFAVRQGNMDAAQALIKAGAKVNHVSAGDHTSPLLMATINGQFDLAKVLLLEDKADPKLASDAGATPLYTTINVQWAAKSLYPQPTAQYQQKTGYLELMELLIKAGADVNARLSKHLWYMSYNFDLLGVNTTGATPFWRAAYGTDVEAMKLLVKYGADVTIATMKPAGPQRDQDGAIVEEGSSATDASGLPQVPAGGPGVYPLHAASGVGYGEGFAANAHRHAPDAWVSSVKYIIEDLKQDVNARDYKGYSALHHAAARGDTVLAAYLISKGADIKAVSRTGQTVADMANGPVQRVPPFYEAVVWFEKAGSKNSNKCKSC